MAHRVGVNEGRDSGGASVDLLASLYQRDYHRYVRVAEAITGDVESARDAVQEGFASALRHRGDYRGSGGVEGWVWRCVVNAARMARRRRRDARLDKTALPDEAEVTAAAAGDVRALVARLPERQRLVVFLRHYADLDYEAIGSVLEIASGTVGATLNAAHRTLRVQLQEVNR